MKALLLALGLIASQPTIPITTHYNPQNQQAECPDDGCSMYYTGKDRWCVGPRCRHIKIFRCGCCSKEWGVYAD